MADWFIEQVEPIGGALARLVIHELGAGLEDADRGDLIRHAEATQQIHVGGQQGFADVEAGVLRLLQQHHVMAALGEHGGGSAAGWAAADNEDVALVRHAQIIPPLMDITCPVM